jgi:hypothetical protein
LKTETNETSRLTPTDYEAIASALIEEFALRFGMKDAVWNPSGKTTDISFWPKPRTDDTTLIVVRCSYWADREEVERDIMETLTGKPWAGR